MFDGLGEAFSHCGDGDLLNELAEEAPDDKTPGLVFGDTACLQVKQLLVVETSGGTGVPGAGDLAGFDFEVGTESARAPSVSTRLRLVSNVSVPVAAARISTSPTHTVCASGFVESDHLAAHPCT